MSTFLQDSPIPVQPLRLSNNMQTRKRGFESLQTLQTNEKRLLSLPEMLEPERKRRRLKEGSSIVMSIHDGLRQRARQQVSSFSKKVKKTMEIWRGDIEV